MKKRKRSIFLRSERRHFRSCKSLLRYLYIISVTALPLIITICSAFISPLLPVAFFPIQAGISMICNRIFLRISKSTNIPEVRKEEAAESPYVLTVITAVLLGEEYDSDLFERLENIFLANNESNIYFGILADICDSTRANAPGDDKILKYAYGRIEALCSKYGKRFILFERRRSYSKSEESFMGWERRNGALCELVKHLSGDSTTFTEQSLYKASEILDGKRIKYIIVLKDDVTTAPGTLRSLCRKMMHPYAKPVVDSRTGIVISGYGMITPRCESSARVFGKTPFSRIMDFNNNGAIISDAQRAVYRNIFGKGVFNGNGIFDIELFHDIINTRYPFPEDKLLCRDEILGEKLRCAYDADVVFTVDCCENMLSYLRHRHKRIRSVIQNLFFTFKNVVFSKTNVQSDTSPLFSLLVLSNGLFSALVPIFSYACIFCAMLCEDALRTLLVFFALFHTALPMLFSLYRAAVRLDASVFFGRFFSRGTTTDFYGSVRYMLYCICMLPMSALYSFDAVIKAVFRSAFSGKNLLKDGRDIREPSKKTELLDFIHGNIFNAFSGFLLFAFSPAGLLRVISLLWFAFPIISYHTCLEKEKSHSNDIENCRKKAESYARDIWAFFRDSISERDNYLPVEGVRFYPWQDTAHRASPTGIGFYMLSVLCARDFGFIDTAELSERLSSTLYTLEKLKKHRGHFYTLYDTETTDVLIPGCISTAESSNLSACFTALCTGLSDYVNEDTGLLTVIKRLEALERNIDFSMLYNSKTELYHRYATISRDGTPALSEDFCDHIMDETLTTSCIQCAKRTVPMSHFKKLCRTTVEKDGYLGLYSRHGSAREYFLPCIFLPFPEHSLLFEAVHFALREQAKHWVARDGKRIFGISESAYYSFNIDMDYRSRTFGISCLAAKKDDDSAVVISPYSSFLALGVDSKKAFSNLDTMAKTGMYGKYGLYEAVDFTKGRCAENGTVIKCYMSHHMGISLCALCNCAFDGILQKRFMKNGAARCISVLLGEKPQKSGGKK